MKANHPEIEQRINEDMEIKPEIEEALKAATSEFKQTVTY
jgi:hypothetical protein